MGDVKSISGGPIEPDEFLGEYLMVYFDEDGNITPIWTDGLTPDQLSHGALKLLNAVNIANFWEDYEGE